MKLLQEQVQAPCPNPMQSILLCPRTTAAIYLRDAYISYTNTYFQPTHSQGNIFTQSIKFECL